MSGYAKRRRPQQGSKQGSGLSIHRFAAKSSVYRSKKKKHRFEQQAKRLQQYRKVVAKEEKAVEELDATVSRRRQFYDEVFADNNNISRLKPVPQRKDAVPQEEGADNSVGEGGGAADAADTNTEGPVRKKQRKKEKRHRPDPMWKAKAKAAEVEAAKAKKQQERAEKEKQRKLAERRRKKRHRLLSKRTAKGQPVTKYAIQDMLSRIQAEKNNA